MEITRRLARLLVEAPQEAGAIEFEGSWWTWGQLQSTARALNAVLDDLGSEPGARVGLVVENRPEHIAVIAALLASSRCIVTLSPLQPPERLSADIRGSRLPVVLAAGDVLTRPGVMVAIESGGLVIELDQTGGLRKRGGHADPPAETSPGIAIEMLTSGTTGPPKRVRLSATQLDAGMIANGQKPKQDRLLRDAVAILSAPMVHIGGIWGAVSALYTGRRIALLRRFEVTAWAELVERHRPRATGLTPAAIQMVLDAGIEPRRLASLQVITSGAAPCPPELAQRLFDEYGIRVLAHYGATEFAGVIAAWSLPLHVEWWSAKAGSVGRPLPGIELRVVSPDGATLEPGEVGNLEIRSKQSPAGDDAWVGTSDLAAIDADGFLWIHGRADDAIIRGGFKIHPDHVKAALERHPAVREAAVAPLPDPRLGQVPVAAVSVRADAPRPDMTELVATCRQVLTPYEVPVHIAVLDELPRTPAMKVSRVDILELVRQSMESQHPKADSKVRQGGPTEAKETLA